MATPPSKQYQPSNCFPESVVRLRVAKRCPGCGHLVLTDPCLECANLRAKNLEILRRKMDKQ